MDSLAFQVIQLIFFSFKLIVYTIVGTFTNMHGALALQCFFLCVCTYMEEHRKYLCFVLKVLHEQLDLST